MQNGLEPVTITAYKDKELRQPDGQPFQLPLNPEQYSQQFKVELDRSQPHGSGGSAIKYKSTAPEQLQLEFLFDSTGALKDYIKNPLLEKKTAREQVELFLRYVYQVNGAMHQPRYLKIQWGSNTFTYQKLSFECIVSQLDVQYVLFNRSGEPLRAKVKATFLRYTEQKKQGALDDHSSPDLTHVRTAHDGDRLPLLTYELLGDQNFYLKVARANNLTRFRPLPVGQPLNFPPVEKPT
jgi:hypothetical protein